jgi:hypothetical protein
MLAFIMPEHSVIVWDLETVPDLAGFAAPNDLVGQSDADVREALGNKFPKQIYHAIVCIGALVAHREANATVPALGDIHRDPSRLIRQGLLVVCSEFYEKYLFNSRNASGCSICVLLLTVE